MLRRSSRNNTGVSTVQTMYNKYANHPVDVKNGDGDKIGPNGIMGLLSDLKLEANDRRVMALIFKMQPERECEFTWTEWQKGLQEMGVDSIEGLRKQLDIIERTFKDVNQLKPLYKYTFDYAKKPGQRNLDNEIALTYWEILFQNQWPLLAHWLEFIGKVHGKPVTKDTWSLLFDFAMTMNTDLSNYNEEESWPVVMDDFVKWARPRLAKQ